MRRSRAAAILLAAVTPLAPAHAHAVETAAGGLDLVLALMLLAVPAAYAAGWRRLRGRAVVGARESGCFALGWLAVAAALLPPLHGLGERWFSAHMIEHELLMAVAAPLLVLGRAGLVLPWALPQRPRRRLLALCTAPLLRRPWLTASAPPVAWFVHTAVLWVWHAPVLFEAALRSEAVHALQHACFIAAALLYWSSLIGSRHGTPGYGAAILSLFATAMQCGILGALLTLAPVPWYPGYGGGLPDQQVAGLVMWVPAGLLYTVAGIGFLVPWLRDAERRARRWESSLGR